jgi:hypothetical protein
VRILRILPIVRIAPRHRGDPGLVPAMDEWVETGEWNVVRVCGATVRPAHRIEKTSGREIPGRTENDGRSACCRVGMDWQRRGY